MKSLSMFLIAVGLLTSAVSPQWSYADDRWGHHGEHHYYHYHDRPHFGVHVGVFYPDEYYPIAVGTSRYYYDDGVYYSYANGNYVVAAPPIGAVVSTIPPDFRPVSINGMTYYTDNGVYYVRTSNGYQVVTSPVR
jgi:hypothetical protein